MTTLPSNVYVVLAMGFPVVFVNEIDACDYANISGTEPVHTCALRTREDAAELISEFTEPDVDDPHDPAPDPRDPGYDLWLERRAQLDRERDR